MTTRWQLRDADSGALVVAQLEVADRFWPRFWGLQFRRSLPPGSGLLLVPCASIHTCWLRFAIDAVWLDRQGQVLGVSQEIRPWRLARAAPGSYAVLELPGASATVQMGTFVRLDVAAKGEIPASLQFLTAPRQAGG